jgi:hypothetical protein
LHTLAPLRGHKKEANESTLSTPFGSCSFKHCGSSATKEVDKSEEEQKFEYELKQLTIGLRVVSIELPEAPPMLVRQNAVSFN